MKPEKKHTLRWKLRGAWFAGIAAAGLMLPSNPASAQPAITGVYPDGIFQFEFTNNLAFVASTPATSITNITVVLTSASVAGGSPFLQILSLGNGVSVSVPGNPETATVALTSNNLYSASITITDSSGNSTNAAVSFDTINPSYTWEAEDWNYTSNAVTGLFINNPQTNAYALLASTVNVDYSHNATGSTNYRPYGLSTENTQDAPRRQYGANFSILQDYDVGFNNGGDYGVYTRNFPSGTYDVFMRGADGNNAQADAASMGGAATGQFNVPNGGWQTWHWVPMTTNGTLATATFTYNPSVPQTITVYTVGGNYNANFYMLVPPVATPAASTVSFTGINPNGAIQFQPTNSFVFDAVSANPINVNNSFVVIVGATNLNGVGSQTLLAGSQLNVTGPTTDRHVTIPITGNMTYSVFIQAVDSNGNPATTNLVFDTITPGYTWEAEDWDYNSGQFANSNEFMVDWYIGAPAATANVDYDYNGGTGVNASYRPIGVDNENAGDRPRPQYLNPSTNDYDLGNTQGGQWQNYTRQYPPGVYNIYVRVSRGNPGLITDAGSVAQVISGQTTGSQTLMPIGQYSVNGTGAWQTYVWAAVTNTNNGALAQFTSVAGSNATLRVTLDNAQHNVNFFMLMPVATSPPGINLKAVYGGGTVSLSFLAPTGHNYQVQYSTTTPSSALGNWTSLGSLITGDNTVHVVPDTPSTGGPHRFYRVLIQ